MTAADPSSNASTARTERPRKRMKIFRASEGTDIQDHMPILGIDANVQAGLQKLAQATGPHPATVGTKTAVLFCEPGEQGLSLSYVWFKSGYILPRHSHNADCLYYVLGGELRLGTQTLSRGDGVFIPADVAYTYEAGPHGVEVLEFRNATRFHFMFQGNDDDHWDRIASVLETRRDQWQDEAPPTERG